jgi:hypothetical protein
LAFPVSRNSYPLYPSEIETGERVLLTEDGGYDPDKSNPIVGTEFECEGTITEVDPMSEEDEEDDFQHYDENACIYVKWDNGHENVYKGGDLILSRPEGNCTSIWRNWRL